MTTTASINEIDSKESYINDMDLTKFVHKLTTRCGWQKKDAQKTAEMYKNYLILKLKYGGEHKLPPSEEIDEFWHHHILDTAQYQKDCEAIFGYYLHHYPYFGIDDKTDKSDLNKAFEKTQELYHKEFGEYIEMSKGIRSRIGIMIKEFLK